MYHCLICRKKSCKKIPEYDKWFNKDQTAHNREDQTYPQNFSASVKLPGRVILAGKDGSCLTSSGKQILPYVRKIVSDFEEIQQKVNEINGIQSGTVRIGTFSSVAINWLPDVFARFQKDYPGIDYEMLLGDYEEVEKWIDEGRVDCGFLRLPAGGAFDVISLKKDEYKAVLPVDHPLAEKKLLDYEDLNDQSFLLLEHGGKTEVSELLEKNHAHPNIRFTTWEDYAIMSMVERGLGVGVLPDMILRRIPYQIAIRSFRNPYFREIGLVMKDRTKLTPATRKFIEYLTINERLERL